MPFSLILEKLNISEIDEVKVYVHYDILDNATLVNLLQGIEKIKNKLIIEYKLDEQLTSLVQAKRKIKPILDVLAIETGHSIIWKYKEGWLPSIKPRKGNLEISINYKIGLTALIVSAIATALPIYLSSRNTLLDNQLKKEEIQIKQIERKTKQIELNDKIEKVNENEKENIKDMSDFIPTRRLRPESAEITKTTIFDFLYYVEKNERIIQMVINDTIIKQQDIPPTKLSVL